MIAALLSPHPRDETLSRLADLSDADQARLRAGRHARRCTQCAATIAEFRALGAAAREIPHAVPSALLAPRIRESAAEVARVAVASGSSSRWSSARTLVPAAIAATVLIALLLWPSPERPDLAAASFERLVLSPQHPVPGTEVGVRWEAPPSLPPRDTVWLHGTLAQGGSESGLALDVRVPLLRSAAGGYRGRLAIPASARSGVLFAAAADGDPLLRGRRATHLLLTGTPGAAGPSLDALETGTELTWSGSATGRTLAAAFERWAPDHPLRPLLVQQRGASRDWLDFFSSRERTYAGLDRTLGSRRTVRVYEMVGMIRLAYAIEEPGEAARWTARLVREHPEHPRALAAQASMLHQLELEGIGRDSIGRLLPSLDALYDASRGRLLDRWTLVELVGRNADSAAAYRWRLRWVRAGFHPTGPDAERTLTEWMRDPALADSAEVEARERLSGVQPASIFADQLWRPRAYVVLAAVSLAQGSPGRAVQLTDSARLAAGPCIRMGAWIRASALLATGDTVQATGAFADHALDRGISLDSARTLIGPRLDAPRWTAATEEARGRLEGCRRRPPA